jgi:hypothetical protein
MIDELRECNQALWEVDRLRALEAAEDFGQEFICLARSVYHANDRRAAIKRSINELLGSAWVEEKVHPAYEAPVAAMDVPICS